MKNLLKKQFVFALFALLSASAFAQEAKYTIKGSIENATSYKIFFSNIIQSNATSGQPELITDEDWKDYTKNNKSIVLSETKTFTISDVEIKKDKDMFFFFDQDGSLARVMISKSSAVKGTIDLGKINFQPTHQVRSFVTFPSIITKEFQDKVQILFSSVTENNDLYLAGMTKLQDGNKMHINLTPGKYTIFFEVPDAEDNWRRVIKTVEVKDNDIVIDPVHVVTSLDTLVAKRETIANILADFDPKALSAKKAELFTKIKNVQSGVQLVYFFAGYCSPCLSPNGLAKYIHLADSSDGKFSVIGIHSDSYKIVKGCPTSQADMNKYLQTAAAWKNIKAAYSEDQDAPVVLSWQSAAFAEKLDINAYPTTLIFKEGKLVKWYVGVNDHVFSTIEELLK